MFKLNNLNFTLTLRQKQQNPKPTQARVKEGLGGVAWW
jgi:hypothetical protein